MNKSKQQQRTRRHARVRAKIKGTKTVPRVSVFRSNKHIFDQLVNDVEGKTVVSINDMSTKKGEKLKKDGIEPLKGKSRKAAIIGVILANEAKKKGIDRVVFDRSGYKYDGRVKAIAEGLRKGGLKF